MTSEQVKKMAEQISAYYEKTGNMIRMSPTSFRKFISSPYEFVEYNLKKHLIEIGELEEDERSEAQAIGLAFEELLVFGEFKTVAVFDERFRPEKDKNFQSKTNKIWRDAIFAEAKAHGKICISTETEAKIRSMYDSIAPKIFWQNQKIETQKHLEGDIFGVPFHGFVDIFAETPDGNFIVEAKTSLKRTDNTSLKYWLRDSGAHVQCRIYELISNSTAFIAFVSTSHPHPSRIFRITNYRQEADGILEKYCGFLKNWYANGCPPHRSYNENFTDLL